MDPLISVIVPVFNGAAHLPALIESLCRQSYERAEYIVVDNGSTDNSSEIIKAATNGESGHAISTRIISETRIQSSYAARNTGIRVARGSILAFTDADCRPAPDWLENIVKPFAESQVGIVAGMIASVEGSSVIEHYSCERQLVSQRWTLEHEFRPFGQTANLAIRRETLEEVGLFRPRLTTAGDADFCWRATLETDWLLRYQSSALIYHQHRKTLAGLLAQFVRYGRAQKYFRELYGYRASDHLSPITIRRFGRWLVKDLLPAAVGGKDPRDLFMEPLDMAASCAFKVGYTRARLKSEQLAIEYLEPRNKAVIGLSKTESRS